MWTEGEGEGETNGERRSSIYTQLCVQQTASGDLLYSTGGPGVHGDDLDR